MANLDEATLEGVAFLGNTLAPFFLQDPRTGLAGVEFAAVAALDAQAAGAGGRLQTRPRPRAIWR